MYLSTVVSEKKVFAILLGSTNTVSNIIRNSKERLYFSSQRLLCLNYVIASKAIGRLRLTNRSCGLTQNAFDVVLIFKAQRGLSPKQLSLVCWQQLDNSFRIPIARRLEKTF